MNARHIFILMKKGFVKDVIAVAKNVNKEVQIYV